MVVNGSCLSLLHKTVLSFFIMHSESGWEIRGETDTIIFVTGTNTGSLMQDVKVRRKEERQISL